MDETRVKTTSLSNKTTSDFGLERMRERGTEREKLAAESEEFWRTLSFVIFRGKLFIVEAKPK